MTRIAEVQSGIALTVSGIIFLNPLTRSFEAIPAYAGLAHIAPEWEWGLIMLAVGIYQLTNLVKDKIVHRGRACFLSACIFFAVSAGLASQPIPRMSLAMGAFPSFFFAQGYTYLKLRSDRRQACLT